MNNRNYFQILGVSEDANFEDIKRSYFEKIKMYHPDKVCINQKLFFIANCIHDV